MQLTVAVWFTGLAAFAVLAFLAWIIWQICSDAYDHFMGHWKRIANRRFDAAANRDAFRFTKGVHK